MACTNPIVMRGKFGGYYDDVYYPCRRCMSCRISITQEWTTRLECELRFHSSSCFLTLTYDDEHLPVDGSLRPEHMRDFLKRLRYYIPEKIKYYGVGEYGERQGRPHYHLIIFGWQPPLDDLIVHGVLRHSKFLTKVWTYGFNAVGTVTHDSIQYTVGYVRKKLYGQEAQNIYGFKVRPFARCSNGIGLRYAQEKSEDIRRNMTVMIKGVNRGLPKYFSDKLELDKDVLKMRSPKRVADVMDGQCVDRMEAEKLIYASDVQKEKNHEALHDLRSACPGSGSDI